ncbi:hypothetical protein C8R45DRAFT_940830 [Mycena sanguinolenta]|nr:hypothetical protein C8R45DRAFT_940830 [Mycena sanguinolenta]
MGRRPKFHTVEAAAAGHCERNVRYTQTPRGQEVRAAARRPPPRRKVSKRPQYTSPQPPPPSELSHPLEDIVLPPLPSKIIDWQNFLLPDDEPMFLAALKDDGGHDFSPLDMWLAEPPFATFDDPNDPESLNYYAYTYSLGVALHGLQLRREQTTESQRRATFDADSKEAMARLKDELLELLERWDRVWALETYNNNSQYSREHALLMHYLRWLARTIYRLHKLKFLE